MGFRGGVLGAALPRDILFMFDFNSLDSTVILCIFLDFLTFLAIHLNLGQFILRKGDSLRPILGSIAVVSRSITTIAAVWIRGIAV